MSSGSAAHAEQGTLFESAPVLADVGLPPLPPFAVHGIERRVVTLRRLPAPDFLAFSVTGALCLLMDDGTDATPALAARLIEEGWHVVLLTLPPSLIPTTNTVDVPNTTRVSLADVSEATLRDTVASLVKDHGGIGAFVLHSPPTQPGMDEKALVRFAFLMAKHLKRPLIEGNSTERKCFIVITHLDGALGTALSSHDSAVSGGLFGLVKTLSLEWDSVFARAIDIAATTNAETIAAQVIAEMHDPSRLLTEVAYSATGRTTLVANTSDASGVR